MSVSKIFLYFCLAFVVGIFLDSLIGIPLILMLGFLLLGLILITVFWRPRIDPNHKTGSGRIALAGFCILFIVLGIWRHDIVRAAANDGLSPYNDTGKEVTLIGIVSREPDVRANSTGLTVEGTLASDRAKAAVSGKILVTASRYSGYKYGDELEITGKLETPSDDIEGFNYKDYLSKDGIYSEMSWPEIRVIGSDRGNFIYARILSFKEKLREVIYENLSPPQSSILGALILGDKRQLSDELKTKLNIAGVRHITAISGMHIAIIAGILMSLALAAGLWRGQAFYITLILLFLYIIMVGAPASAVRAGVMGGVLLLGQKIGRISVSSRAVVFVAALMLFQNPQLLRFDVGFQLSFLAVMGIIYLMPHFQEWFSAVPNPSALPLRDLLSMTISAQVFTLPILIYNFGYFSLVAPLTNILIVPLLPYVMILGFIFGIFGIILPTLGSVLAWGSWLLLTYVIKVVDFFSKLPFSNLKIEKISWVWLAMFYLILVIIVWRLREKQKLKFLNY